MYERMCQGHPHKTSAQKVEPKDCMDTFLTTCETAQCHNPENHNVVVAECTLGHTLQDGSVIFYICGVYVEFALRVLTTNQDS